MIITNSEQLTKECKDVSLMFDGEHIISKLEEQLAKSSGVGLAANQIGIDAKVCIIRAPNAKINLINPVIEKKYDLKLFKNEGCLSFPGEWLTTSRYNEIVVKDLLHPAGIICTGFEAVVVQHEVDHLYGKLMHEYIVKIPGRNEPCWCGSKRKYKKCHLGQEIRIPRY
jgi:peptide deformylase